MSDEYYQPRKVNLLAIAIVLVGTAGAGAGLFFLHRWQIQRHAEDFLARSQQAEADGQLRKAADLLMQYLALRPNAPETTEHLAHYAELSKKLAGNPRQALRALYLIEEVLRREPGRDDFRREAARLSVDLGRLRKSLYKDALDHIKALQDGEGDDDELRHLAARAMAGTGDFEKARVLYEQLSEQAPENIVAWEERLTLVRDSLNDPTTADELVAKMIQKNPDSALAHQVAARHFLQRVDLPDHLDKALERVTAAQKLGARSADLALLGAELAASKGRADEARKRLQEGQKQYPDDAVIRLTAARVELRSGETGKARELLEPFRKSLPGNPEHLCELGLLLLELGGDPKEIFAIRRRLNGVAWAEALLTGQECIRRQEWGKAREELEKLRLKRPPRRTWDRQFELMLAECYRALGNPDQQAEAARRALKADPSSPLAKLQLARALEATGKLDQAMAAFKGVGGDDRAGRMARLRMLISRERRKEEKQRDWSEVEKALAELPKEDKDTLEVSMIQAEVAAVRGKPEEARKFAEAARARDPKQAGPWFFLVDLARLEGKPARALSTLEQAERQVGPRVDWPAARVRLAVSTGGKDGLDQLRALDEQRRKFTGGERDLLTAWMAQAYSRLGDAAAAEKLFLELAESQKANLEVRVLLAERAFRSDKKDQLRKYAAEVTEAEGKGGPYGSYLQAMLCLARGREGHAEARKHLALAAKLRPSWPRVLALEAELDDREEKHDDAAKKYVAAIELGESRAFVQRRAVFLLFELGRYAEADGLLRRLPESMRTSGELGRLTAAMALGEEEAGVPREQRRKQALEMARQMARDDTRDFRNFVFLGQLASLAGEDKEAEQALLKGRAMAPGEVSAWVALIQFLARTDPARARKELAQLEQKMPDKKSALATCHEILGQAKEAQKYYEEALASRPNHPAVVASVAAFRMRQGQVEEAKTLWRKVLKPEVPASEVEKRAARRALAILLALSGSYEDYKEAREQIEANLKAREAVEDRRAQALVMATQPAERREAIKLFEKLSPLSGGTPPEMQLLLARLCESEPELKAKAVDYVEALVHNAPDTPLYLSYAAMVYLRQSQPDRAEAMIDRLAKRTGETFEVAELRARLLKARGKAEEARKLIEGQVKDRDERLAAGSLILDTLGEHAAAEAMLRRLAFTLKRPEGLVLLAQHLGRRKRLQEALDVCEQARATARPEDVAAACMRVLRENGGTPAQQERVIGWLEAARRKHPQSVALLACQADLEDMRGRYDAVVALYRQLLELQPENVVALNNLAYYLSVKEGKHEEALRLLEKVVKARGPIGEILDTRGVVYLNAGKAEDAVRDFQAAVKQDPGPVKLFHLARGQLAMQELSTARASFQRAKERGLKEEQLPPLERQAWKDVTEKLGSD
jgi:tetratricopeptide (TPR) repeat protein